jgi:hypothetical protein
MRTYSLISLDMRHVRKALAPRSSSCAFAALVRKCMSGGCVSESNAMTTLGRKAGLASSSEAAHPPGACCRRRPSRAQAPSRSNRSALTRSNYWTHRPEKLCISYVGLCQRKSSVSALGHCSWQQKAYIQKSHARLVQAPTFCKYNVLEILYSIIKAANVTPAANACSS